MSDPDNNSYASSSDNDTENTRPNRWTGPPTTWQTFTEAERGLAASLDTLRNADLSVHLFNAHALKRRARELEGPESSSKSVSDFPGIPEEDQAFKPSKGWTAWPLPPDEVPRAGEHIGPPKPFEEYTFKAQVGGAPSRELEDVLMSVTLRYAKERFESREEAEEEIPTEKGKGKGKAILDEDMDSSGSEYRGSDIDEPAVKESPKSPQPQIYLKPVVSADDERSRDLLRPSVRHTLSKLDEILIALHHARKTCHRYSHSEAGTTDDESVADTSFSVTSSVQNSPTKRPKGRPRKFANLPNRAKTNIDPNSDVEPEKIDPSDLLRSKTTHLGRPKKVYNRLPNESQQDYVVRIARIQKKPLPAFAPPTEPKLPKSPSPRRGRDRERSRSAPANRATEEELRVSRRRKLALRDWSEVLGVAALVGFDEGALERAAKRCAGLFGEGMVMRRMPEVSFGEREGRDQVVKYEPELIPDFGEGDMIDPSSSSDGESGVDSDSDSESEVDIKPGIRTTSNISQQTVFCPIPACPRGLQGFRDTAAMKRHLIAGHKIQKEDVGDYVLPSDEEMDGAVHVDGFLRVIKRAGMPRGRYKKEKKVKRGREEGSGDDGDQGDDGNEDVEIKDAGRSSGKDDEGQETESGSSDVSSS